MGLISRVSSRTYRDFADQFRYRETKNGPRTYPSHHQTRRRGTFRADQRRYRTCRVQYSRRAEVRALYGSDIVKNAVHGSANATLAQKEIQFFFPNQLVGEQMTKTETDDYVATELMPALNKGLIKLCESKPENPRQWLANWLASNNPHRPCVE